MFLARIADKFVVFGRNSVKLGTGRSFQALLKSK